ncbi:MAG: hypothetical protein IIB38_10225, partial [Candidatus Hydrogenedentes bacterium]|nr:hypothetical protein [Candidatus Hydrogenedentota bacterium]
IRKWWEDGCGNSVRIGVDDFPPYVVGGDGTYKYWDWIKMSVTLELPAGDHRLTLYNNEDGVWVDQILLTSDPEYVPVGQESAAGSDPSRAEIYFSDDFMREEEQKGAWKVVSGTWETGSIRNPERSANAFQYISSGRKERLSTTGYSFWRDYSVEVSAMSAGRADMGISFLGSGASDCYLWRIPVAEGRTMRLVKIVGGEEETLFETAGRLIPGQWYRLQVTVCRGGIALAIDGCVVGRVSDFTYLRGGVGLFSKGIGETFFDDVLVRSVRLILDDFTDSMLSAWDITGNAFRTYGALDQAVMSAVMGNGFGADPSPPSGEVPMLAAVGKGKAITGSVYWDKYTFSFSVLPYLPSRWWALVGCGGDETVSFLFEGDEQGVTVSLEGSDSPVHVPCKWRSIWHRIEIGSGDGIVTLNIDGTAVLEASRTVSDGLVGFHSETGGILFDNVAVRMNEAPSSGETVTHQFALEDTMKNWASRKYVWKDIDETGRSLWNRLDFPGNVRLTYSYGGELAEKETLRLGMSSKEGDKRDGCVLTVKRAGIVLETDTGGRSEAKLENARIDSVSVRRGGGSIIGAVNGRDLVKLASDLKEGADRLWIASSASEVDVDKISLNAPDVTDYTMSMAPVDRQRAYSLRMG